MQLMNKNTQHFVHIRFTTTKTLRLVAGIIHKAMRNMKLASAKGHCQMQSKQKLLNLQKASNPTVGVMHMPLSKSILNRNNQK